MKKSGSLSAAVLLILAVTTTVPVFAQNASIKNIILVHGAWVDGSGWKPVYDILVKDGYTVSVVQEPLTSFSEDVAATRRIIDQQSGPSMLVGHSYGGSVITEAGTDEHVAGLVYVAAHMPDAGESEASDGKRYPSDLAKSTFIKKTPDNYNYLDPGAFPAYFGPASPSGAVRSPLPNTDSYPKFRRHHHDPSMAGASPLG